MNEEAKAHVLYWKCFHRIEPHVPIKDCQHLAKELSLLIVNELELFSKDEHKDYIKNVKQLINETY